ncbi:nickel/cobalt ABC transporter permease [Dickeya solani]|uniref:Transport of nickel, membrane protein n=1 Tax=Dickeya solani D s0432-1 TaxID=1231725 RepID=A0AAV3KBF4_9GAMM|nr:nickel/cobalt ABC transporter permease [Dickeya solani]ANE76758.1 nickel ABC transporter permease subunit NikB [Dickeya solani IPO 2222]AUC44437.1 Nickel transport system permease protein NikB [Dickeya solani RNS 08.23.3.1.A]AUH07831.1 nickel ABC transporter permease subunit NikB [Dickeya solani D s0432-1]AUH11854.1 nickel ABC transporter permease subunit NikB [Dickeya solani]AYQ47279.1 Nickel transport system permease protein NikB [Dickeya solani]
MRAYFIKRLFMTLPLAVVVSLVAFSLLNLVPSDPAEVALRVNDIVPTDAAVQLMRHELGLDRPFLQRYLLWLWKVLQFDFGTSFITRQPVWHEFMQALPATLYLAAVSLVMIVTLSLTLGIACAVTENTLFDNVVRSLVFLTVAIPNYWIGLLLLWGLAVNMDLFPVGGMQDERSVILPSCTLMLGYIGTYIRLIRGSMIGNLRQNYVLYARARGLPTPLIIGKHVLVNSLHASLVAIGMSIPKLIAGTVVIENIFAWPGVGRLCLSAIFNRDYPMIQAYMLLMALLFLGCNLLTDLLQAKLDPRIRGEG